MQTPADVKENHGVQERTQAEGKIIQSEYKFIYLPATQWVFVYLLLSIDIGNDSSQRQVLC